MNAREMTENAANDSKHFTLLTGASSGLGRAAAIRLSHTRRLILSGRNVARLEETREVCARSAEHILWPFDLAETGNIGGSLTAVLAGNHVAVDAFVHCAGTVTVLPARSLQASLVLNVMATNFLSAAEVVRILLTKASIVPASGPSCSPRAFGVTSEPADTARIARVRPLWTVTCGLLHLNWPLTRGSTRSNRAPFAPRWPKKDSTIPPSSRVFGATILWGLGNRTILPMALNSCYRIGLDGSLASRSPSMAGAPSTCHSNERDFHEPTEGHCSVRAMERGSPALHCPARSRKQAPLIVTFFIFTRG